MHCDTAIEGPLSSSNHLSFLIICLQVKNLICCDKTVQLENCGVSSLPTWNDTGQDTEFQKATLDFHHKEGVLYRLKVSWGSHPGPCLSCATATHPIDPDPGQLPRLTAGLPHHCGLAWQSLILVTVSRPDPDPNSTSELDFGPTLSLQICLVVWPLGWTQPPLSAPSASPGVRWDWFLAGEATASAGLVTVLSSWPPCLEGTALPLLHSDTELQQPKLATIICWETKSDVWAVKKFLIFSDWNAEGCFEVVQTATFILLAEASPNLVLATARYDTRVNRESVTQSKNSGHSNTVSLLAWQTT